MKYLTGILIQLKTGTGKYAGTDDPLYLGVSGTAGGREFPLDVRWFDDAERGSLVKYHLGRVWDEAATVGARQPKMGLEGWNDPHLFYVGFEGIDRVYLRKESGLRPGDDAYQLDEIVVRLYGEEPDRRVFYSQTAIWLGREYGAQVWIPESSPPGADPP